MASFMIRVVDGKEILVPEAEFIAGIPSGAVKVPFSWGDATPKSIILLLSNTTVFTATILITAAFDGVGAALMLGDAVVSDRLIPADYNDPTQVGEYEVNPGFSDPDPTQIILTINPGSGATAGAGYVLLEV